MKLLDSLLLNQRGQFTLTNYQFLKVVSFLLNLWVSFTDFSFDAITKCSSRKYFQPTEHINNSKKEPTVVGYSRKESLLKYCSSEEEIEKIISDATFAWC